MPRFRWAMLLLSLLVLINDVTVAQFRKFCTATGREMPALSPWLKGLPDYHPVENVTWDDAKAYADWAHAALPTEAQWEKAARGTDGRLFPWGNKWDAAKCCNGVGKNRAWHTSPVASYPSGASPYGCLDMAGNVWQWCADCYDRNYYQHSPSRNPTGPKPGNERVLRGGSWDYSHPSFFCTTSRFSAATKFRSSNYNGIGFRCVWNVKQ